MVGERHRGGKAHRGQEKKTKWGPGMSMETREVEPKVSGLGIGC